MPEIRGRFAGKTIFVISATALTIGLIFVSGVFAIALDHNHLCLYPREVYEACQKGDADLIMKIARKCERAEKSIFGRWRTGNPTSLLYYSLAFEMQGEYDRAFEYRRCYADMNKTPYEDYDFARILFKNGQKTRAFAQYCDVAEKAQRSIEKSKVKLEDADARFSEITSDIYGVKYFAIIQHILPGRFRHVRPYLPELPKNVGAFESFHEFIEFMENEYAKAENKDEYAEAMKFFYACDEYNDRRTEQERRLKEERERELNGEFRSATETQDSESE